MMVKRIGFTGTREGMTYAQKCTLAGLLLGDEFHHGDCFGADGEAHDIAVALGLDIVIHPPASNALRVFKASDQIRPVASYLDRNKNIVRETEILLAAPKERDEQLRSGTWSTARYARKLGRPYRIILPNGSVLEYLK